MINITTKYVIENGFDYKMNIKELSKYALVLDILLMDKVKKD